MNAPRGARAAGGRLHSEWARDVSGAREYGDPPLITTTFALISYTCRCLHELAKLTPSAQFVKLLLIRPTEHNSRRSACQFELIFIQRTQRIRSLFVADYYVWVDWVVPSCRL